MDQSQDEQKSMICKGDYLKNAIMPKPDPPSECLCTFQQTKKKHMHMYVCFYQCFWHREHLDAMVMGASCKPLNIIDRDKPEAN